jgi:uncharacterized phage protein (predicted DNA packaging)
MALSGITAEAAASYLRLINPSQADLGLLGAMIAAASSHIQSATGKTPEALDALPDVDIAALVLTAHFWDNRSYYMDTNFALNENSTNKAIDAIVNAYCGGNLIG